ncbi:oocyte zinc finger protein XlCOF22-like [Ornithodoros turicata]|uniref:oocyte zinc finger protein XlCOF22-like n=1 Tax=Ornithodoros turicata TaxID=34597 RepID=UPI003139EB9E
MAPPRLERDTKAEEDISFEDFPRGIASFREEESRKERRGADSVAKQEEDCSFQYFPRSTAVSSEERRKMPPCRAKKAGRFKCRFCDYCSDRSCHVEVHERTHTGEKPHLCPLCPKCFAGKGSLRKHIRDTHKDRGIYECSTSGAFLRQERLREYEMAHISKAYSHERQPHGRF